MDEDWGAAVINIDEVEETLGLALTTRPFSSQLMESSNTDLEILPNVIPVDDLAEFLREKGGHSVTQQTEMVRQTFNFRPEDIAAADGGRDKPSGPTCHLICLIRWRTPHKIIRLVPWLFRRLRRNTA